MRSNPLLALLLTLVLTAPAAAQQVAVHQPAATPAPTPAQATAATIIPGSPLAALTGAGNPSDTDADTPAPFGTSAIALSITRIIGTATKKSVDDFIAAVQQSTRLDPVWDWLKTFPSDPQRRAHLVDIIKGLAVTLLPAVLADAAMRQALKRPLGALANRAVPNPQLPEPDPDPEPEDENANESEEDSTAGAESSLSGRPHRRDFVLAWLRHCMFALLGLALNLLPVFGFVLVIQLLLAAGLVATRDAQLGCIGIANAYLFCRITRELVSFLAGPKSASLRLIAMPDARAAAILVWSRVLLASGFAGYVLISVAEILNLSRNAATPLIWLFGLILHVEVAVIIWQSRRPVGRWIGGRPGAHGAFAAFRRWVGRIWAIPALIYVLALWLALAAGVHHAFGILLRIVLVTVLAALLGRAGWSGSTLLLERLFPDPSNSTARHTAFAARARAYNPLIRVLIRVLIAVLVIVLVLQGWGLNAFGWLLTNPLSRSVIGACIAIIVTIAIALILWECANAMLNGRVERLSHTGRARQASRLRTLLPMIRASIGVTLFLVAGLLCLSKIGVNAAPLLAGAGVLGIAIGFGSQKLVQDIITGLFLLLEDAMQVGDVISLAGMTGTVERLSIRTIRLRGGDGSINIIPFSAVTTVTNMTRDFGYAQISIQVAYEEDLPRVYAVLTDIARTMRQEPAWSVMMRDDLQLFGLDQFGASALVITGQIRTGPGQHWAVRREFYARVKARFEAEHIEMPYTYLPPAPPRVEGPVESKQGQGGAAPLDPPLGPRAPDP
jgi:small conductance mechanosensitive channel